MDYLNRYFVRPAGSKIGSFAVYKNIGIKRAEEFYIGSKDECYTALANLLDFYQKVQSYIDKHDCIEGLACYLVCASTADDRHYDQELNMDVDIESFIDLIISDMREADFSPCSDRVVLDSITYLHGLKTDCYGRYCFIPEEGSHYRNISGGFYKCLQNFDGFSVLQADSGWTFKAYGIVIDDDGFIEWDSSTNGRFEKIGRMSELQKEIIFNEMRLKYAIEDCRCFLSEKKNEPDAGEYWLPLLDIITKEDIQDMAKDFIGRHTRSVSDNELWTDILDDYISTLS